jgi:hypothetical protein
MAHAEVRNLLSMSFAAFHLGAQAALGLRLPMALWPSYAANSGAARARLMQTARRRRQTCQRNEA